MTHGVDAGLQGWLRRRADLSVCAEATRIASAAPTFAERVRALRRLSGLRQRDIVRALALAQDRISNLERSTAAPAAAELTALAELFGIDEVVLRGADE